VSTTDHPPAADPAAALVALYDDAVGDVYAYLLRRCRNRAEAEDLTSDVFMAAAEAVRKQPPPNLSVAWLIGVARHKLVDHWRRDERERRRLQAVADDVGTGISADPWDVELDILVARDVLTQLGAHHRSALTLRYLDGLPVPEMAPILDRTVHATEALLVRAKRAFRALYEPLAGGEGPDRGAGPDSEVSS
jgi:RNA polymerase sigma-70 factor (ECF subfamily)